MLLNKTPQREQERVREREFPKSSLSSLSSSHLKTYMLISSLAYPQTIHPYHFFHVPHLLYVSLSWIPQPLSLLSTCGNYFTESIQCATEDLFHSWNITLTLWPHWRPSHFQLPALTRRNMPAHITVYYQTSDPLKNKCWEHKLLVDRRVHRKRNVSGHGVLFIYVLQ